MTPFCDFPRLGRCMADELPGVSTMRIEEELDRWETELETERSTMAKSIVGIDIGDTLRAVPTCS